MDAIVLAGGLGTRLRSEISDLPKPMAPINGRPFLDYLLAYLQRWSVERAILATGYLHEKIEAHYSHRFGKLAIEYSLESEPLGTGGCVRRALGLVQSEVAVIANGDTFFDVDLRQAVAFHRKQQADLTIALKPMRNISRYGVVRLDGTRIVSFEEKKQVDFGHINGGVYVADRNLFDGFDLPTRFSLEQDFLNQQVDRLNLHAFVSEGYFIDIGVPEDYQRAQTELQRHAKSPVS